MIRASRSRARHNWLRLRRRTTPATWEFGFFWESSCLFFCCPVPGDLAVISTGVAVWAAAGGFLPWSEEDGAEAEADGVVVEVVGVVAVAGLVDLAADRVGAVARVAVGKRTQQISVGARWKRNWASW